MQFEGIKIDWLKQFSGAVGSFLDHHLIPSAVWIVGVNNLLPIFNKWIKEGIFNELVWGGGKFTSQVIQQEPISIERDYYDTILNYGRN